MIRAPEECSEISTLVRLGPNILNLMALIVSLHLEARVTEVILTGLDFAA